MELLRDVHKLRVQQKLEWYEILIGYETNNKYVIKDGETGRDIRVYYPLDTLIGTVEQECSWVAPKFSIKNADGELLYLIKGPFCINCQCIHVPFKITKENGAIVGTITKEWSGFAQEFFTDSDNFGISFPREMDVAVKTILLGACFLIDYMFYENNEPDSPRISFGGLGISIGRLFR